MHTLPQDALLPCPFCGEHLVTKSDPHGNWFAHQDESAACIVAAVQMLEMTDVHLWNERYDYNDDMQRIIKLSDGYITTLREILNDEGVP